MTVERRALTGSLATGLAFVVQFGQAIVLVPLFLQQWGKERYGLWLALLAAYGIIITLDAGHQAYIGNEIARLYPVDLPATRRVLASAFWVACGLGVLEFALGAVLWLGGALPVLVGASEREVSRHLLGPALLCLLAVWALVGSVGGILARVLAPAQRYTRAAVWGIVMYVVLLLVLAAGLLAGASIVQLVVAQALAQLVVTAITVRDISRVCRQLYPFWQPADVRFGLQNLLRSMVLTGTSLLNQLQQSGLTLLVSGKLGAALLPVFTTSRTLANVFVQGTNVVAGPLAPDIMRYHAKREPDKLVAAWAGIWFVGGALINVGLVGALVVVEPFYRIWTRGELQLDWGVYLPLVAAVAVKSLGMPLTTYLVGLNHLRGLATVAVTQSAVVLLGAWVLSAALGLAGAALSILTAEVLGLCVTFGFVRVALRTLEVPFPVRHFVTALAPVLVTCATFAAVGATMGPSGRLVALALVLLAVVLLVQWRELPLAVRERVHGLLRRAKPAP